MLGGEKSAVCEVQSSVNRSPHPSNICVTGGAGFIGSHVTEALLSKGVNVRIVDNLESGKKENVPAQCLDDSIFADVQSSTALDCILHQCDAVIHLAACPSVQESFANPEKTHIANYESTARIARSAGLSRCKHIVFASSAAVYGNSPEAVREDSRLNPLSPYALDKMSSENILKIYAEVNGFTYTILRFFNVFGPRQTHNSPYSGVISKFTHAAQVERKVKIFGDGEQLRDFIHVSDVAQIVADAAVNPEYRNKTMNVATGSSVTLLDLHAALEANLGHSVETEFFPPAIGDIRISKACNQTLRSIRGDQPFMGLKDGLRTLLDHSRSEATEGALI